MLENLSKYHILLASKSPRRNELLRMLRIPFNVIHSACVDETYPDTLPPAEIPQYLSEKKADAYLQRLQSNELIITADTIVVLGDKVLGKPHSPQEAVEMLMSLSGNTHQVVTGVTVACRDRRTSFTSTTEVKFSEISRREAQYYVDSFNSLDKAGAYGIQEWIGAIAVEGINGSFYNVMGLPVNRLYQELKLF